MDAVSTPAPEVFDIHMVVSPSMRTRLPVVSSSKEASLVTGEFLYIIRRSLSKNQSVGIKSLIIILPAKAFVKAKDPIIYFSY